VHGGNIHTYKRSCKVQNKVRKVQNVENVALWEKIKTTQSHLTVALKNGSTARGLWFVAYASRYISDTNLCSYSLRCNGYICYIRNYNIEEIGSSDANIDWSSDEHLGRLTDIKAAFQLL